MKERRERGKGQVRWYKGKASVRIPLGAPFGRKTFALASSLTTEAALLRLAEAYEKQGKTAEANATRKKANAGQIAAPGNSP